MKKLLAFLIVTYAIPVLAVHSYFTFKGVIGIVTGNDSASYVYAQNIHVNDSVTYIMAIDTTLAPAIDRKGFARITSTKTPVPGVAAFFDSLASIPKFVKGKGDSSILYDCIRASAPPTGFAFTLQTIYTGIDTNINVQLSFPGSSWLPSLGAQGTGAEIMATKVNGVNHTATIYSQMKLVAISNTPPTAGIQNQTVNKLSPAWADAQLVGNTLNIKNYSQSSAEIRILNVTGKTLRLQKIKALEALVLSELPKGVFYLRLSGEGSILQQSFRH